jgi:hypothetical protein
MDAPQGERRVVIERLLADVGPPVHLTPMTLDVNVAAQWLDEFEGAGLDGVIAKPADAEYQPGRRAMIRVKLGVTHLQRLESGRLRAVVWTSMQMSSDVHASWIYWREYAVELTLMGNRWTVVDSRIIRES